MTKQKHQKDQSKKKYEDERKQGREIMKERGRKR